MRLGTNLRLGVIVSGAVMEFTTLVGWSSAYAGLAEDEQAFEAEHPLAAEEYSYEQKAAEAYRANEPYAAPNPPSPAMADLLDRIFVTYSSRADYAHDLIAYRTWMASLPNVVSYFDSGTSHYTAMQQRMLGLSRKACNYTVFVMHGAIRDSAWIQGGRGRAVSVQSRAADFDDRTSIDRQNPRGTSNVFNGVPFVGAQASFMHIMKGEFVDNLIQFMNYKHLNSMPLYFVVNREPVRSGHPGHVFMITGIRRTGNTTGRSSFTFQMREGSLDESFWRARTRDAQVDKFMNSALRFNLLVPTQAFAFLYDDEMETRFTIRENKQHQGGGSANPGGNSSGGFDDWFMPILR